MCGIWIGFGEEIKKFCKNVSFTPAYLWPWKYDVEVYAWNWNNS